MKAVLPLPSCDYLHKTFSIEDGVLYWKISKSSKVFKKRLAGGLNAQGYLVTGIQNKVYRNARIIWKMYYGADPKGGIDHIDHNRLNNKIENLRDVSRKENCRNRSMTSQNTSGVVGVYRRTAENKWCAQIDVNSQNIQLGSFTNKEDAIKARKEAEIKYGFHPNHGKKPS